MSDQISRHRNVMLPTVVGLLLLPLLSLAQLSPEDITALQEQAQQEGWTFEVGANSATQYSLDQLCGLREPADWQATARFDPMRGTRTLPERFDWRDSLELPPIRNQGGCGSCWAFGTVGPLECNIAIWDGMIVDLSEQWLVSCNRRGWGCAGGWWAHDYHRSSRDYCDSTGAVLEIDYPYTATDGGCSCPDPHPYRITDWAYIGSSSGIPGPDLIKQAILDQGPVAVAVYVNYAFQAYNGGVFSGCDIEGEINHAVVLVGWDDNQGPYGVWFLRNSWGPGWGEAGYMRITYGCSLVGYAANYIDYPGGVYFTADTTFGWVPFDVTFTGSSGLEVDNWSWAFGDGDSAFVETPTHTYTEPGLYSVTARIDAGGDVRERQRYNYIKALADTLIPGTGEGGPYATVAVPVYAHNCVPVNSITIPVEYDGALDLVLDSFSTAGCRTTDFDDLQYMHFDPVGKRKTIRLRCSDGNLATGEGNVVTLYFRVQAGAQWDDTTIIRVDGYNMYEPEFSGVYATYQPVVSSSMITSCPLKGDVNGVSGISVADLSYLVDYLFLSGPEPLPIPEAADLNCTGDVNVADLSYFVDYLFRMGPPPCGCS